MPTVAVVDTEQHEVGCYLVEWYRPDLTESDVTDAAARLDECAASMSVEGSPVRLLMTLAVPIDEVVFGVFAAGSADTVAKTCRRAAMPPQRLTATMPARILGRD
jgi:hypothetical protein